MIIGYARVSTDGQTLDAQQSALAAAGAERVFAEKVSGVVTDRKALSRAIAALGAGDVLLVTRLDRLARSRQGPSERAGRGRQGRCGVQIAGRCLGRHDNSARQADAHRPGRSRRVRAGANPRSHQRGPHPRQSPRGKVRPQASAYAASATRGASPTRSWRGLRRDRTELCSQPQHDQSACGGVGQASWRMECHRHPPTLTPSNSIVRGRQDG